MKNKRLKFIVYTITCIITINYNVVWAESSSSIQQEIDKNKQSVEKLESEKNKINGEKSQEKSKLDGILSEIENKTNILNSVNEEVNSYQSKIDNIQTKIDNIHNDILVVENEIQEKQDLIVQKEQEEKTTQATLETRLRSYYKIDMASQYLYMIIESKSITELFNTTENIFRIMKLDKELISKVKEAQKELKVEKDSLNEKVEKMNKDKEEVIAKQDELKEAQKEFLVKQEEQQKQMNELRALEEQKSGYINSLSDKENQLAGKIGDLLAYNEDLQAELDAILANINNSNNLGNNESSNNSNETTTNSSEETFLRPGGGEVTDDYGPRINPVTGASGFHKGVDLGDSYGAPVRAAKSGTVEYVGVISGYGNTVIINHGNGVQTLYAHNSEFSVSVGQVVKRGDTIAKVGSTGMSTGPHIHWEIRVNGQHISPMPYV
ncbi:murein hydrolase activator EnvC family protein [Clostridium chauvoei]|uniref:Peptidoglycan DD-metalloendopeptidase family protein n=2 Tax=Clostridium chauvoei TaxID=46867 RepID=A0ABD4RGX6_9CLOT|nr:M23 family metallopeptidase [Clostridium chauvoei]ATD55669.1 hypothetical protein BTM20_10650 [Clostridium chauvoei]ATD56654.1 hypothetical protein BTM21_02370 [Clostridium chauvoei]MBX7280091.1 peptidoglycan DD-metalloendopeptidase family protein [Clostridium chauvoei]MBX7282575.1 peptidoglycan DD-metalloendopeptidase family protein [Clostridium chauvoei]MBX7284982.1 peptidoglycan DD-metalloendopeptidase family protein [Clostridium chauvoei]